MNKYTILVVLAIIQGFSCDEEGGDPWKHDKQDSWGEDHPDCNGKEQSPINLLSSNNETQGKPIPLNGYSTKHKGSDLVLSNNGHTAKLSLENIPQEARPSITVEDHTYTLDEVHFHWGGGPGRGSEHLINWKQYDLEAHLVHRNSEMESVAEAAGQENGITVIALLYEERSGLFGYDSDIKAITSRLPIIQNEGNTARLTVRNFEFGKNFPLEKLKTYYNYEGSLTTPGCSEKVNWIVFDKIQGVAAGEVGFLFEFLFYMFYNFFYIIAQELQKFI